jgi:hypothetical protein
MSLVRKRQLGVRGEPTRFVSDPEFLSSKLSRARPETVRRVNNGFVSNPERTLRNRRG